CREAPQGGTPELSERFFHAVNTFQFLLAAPARAKVNPELEAAGARVFERVGCAGCHVPQLPVPRDSGSIRIDPYTDLLLHDLGAGLADAAGEGAASASEWRTPPLWGLGLVEGKPNARFLHDARASTLSDAIRWHGGEALPAQRAFVQLADADQSALLGFLRSL
ncbi:MAG: di-heme oxidoredictase family protein, partial [Polyangiaceae bacterium]